MSWVALGFVFVATWCDLRTREIPDALSAALLILAGGASLLGISAATPLQAAAGAGVAFVATICFFQAGVLGGGDVKLLTAVGACVGPLLTASVLVWTGLFGGAFGFASLVHGRRDLAFVPAIAAGLAMVVFLQAGFFDVLLGR